jgi:hypothetical protein
LVNTAVLLHLTGGSSGSRSGSLARASWHERQGSGSGHGGNAFAGGGIPIRRDFGDSLQQSEVRFCLCCIQVLKLCCRSRPAL